MRGVVMYGPGDVRVEDREDPTILEPTDAIIRVTASCICGSDLWPWRGQDPSDWPIVMGHEYVGVVELVGADVQTVRVGDFVVGSFFASDNTCDICRAGYQSRCVHAVLMGAEVGTQAQRARIPYADGTLVATPGLPDADLVPSPAPPTSSPNAATPAWPGSKNSPMATAHTASSKPSVPRKR